jgi:hypothetical protein
MKRIKPSKKMSLHAETVRNLTPDELTAVNGAEGSSAKCLLSDYSALFGVSTTAFVCPN